MRYAAAGLLLLVIYLASVLWLATLLDYYR